MFEFFSRSKSAASANIVNQPSSLWAYPLLRFSDRDGPFASFTPNGTTIKPSLIEVRDIACTGYVFFYYLTKLWKHFGVNVAIATRLEIKNQLNAGMPEFGDELESVLQCVEQGMESGERIRSSVEAADAFPIEFSSQVIS